VDKGKGAATPVAIGQEGGGGGGGGGTNYSAAPTPAPPPAYTVPETAWNARWQCPANWTQPRPERLCALGMGDRRIADWQLAKSAGAWTSPDGSNSPFDPGTQNPQNPRAGLAVPWRHPSPTAPWLNDGWFGGGAGGRAYNIRGRPGTRTRTRRDLWAIRVGVLV
jgi:hypothetical protein